jgi:large subunit ribosomal protein L15
MQSNTLKPTTDRIKSARVGRGGKRGKTSGRGHKGQKARAGHRMRPEMRDLIKKIPKLRGHGKNRSRTVRINRTEFVPVNLSVLEAVFENGASVTGAILAKKGIVSLRSGRVPKVKILGGGTLSKSLTVSASAVSGAAKAAIEKAGGTVVTG